MNEFDIILTRGISNGVCTIGTIEAGGLQILSMEDPPQEKKIPGNTRIPAGRYELKLRKFGRFHEIYKERYPFHRGMLWLQDVPRFEDVLIHSGNHAGDTRGCILTGSRKVNENWVDDSEKALLALTGYTYCLFDLGYRVFINIKDE